MIWFQIYSVPDFKMCFYVKNFPMGHKVLVDSGQVIDTAVKPRLVLKVLGG